jgi:hypothetical protein
MARSIENISHNLPNFHQKTAVFLRVIQYRIVLFFYLLLFSFQGKSQIVINEIGIGAPCPNFFNCSDAGGGGEFIELFNKSGCTQNIGCYVLVYSGPNGAGWSVTIPAGTTLGAGQYYLIAGNSSSFVGSSVWNTVNPSNTTSWVNSYSTYGKDVADLDLKKANTSGKGMVIGNLPNTGGQITLFKPDGITVSSSVAYNSGNNSGTYPVTPNASGCSINSLANPGNTTAFILGRDFSSYYAGLYLDANGNYQSSINDVNQYPTPGKANNTNGGSTQQTTASLPAANVGNNNSVCIGSVLVYSGPNGAGWSVTIPAGTTLGAGQYYLIAGNSSSFVGSSVWNTVNPSNTTSWVNSYSTYGKDVADLDLKKANTSGKGMVIGNLPNTGGQITLFKPDGITVSSSVAYNSGNNSGTYPVTPNASGCSINSLANPGNTTAFILGRDFSSYYAGLYLDANGNYQSSINDVNQYPTPGKANNTNGGSTQQTTASLPAANVGNNNSVCIGSSVTLGSTSVPGNTYSWISSPAGFVSNSSTISVSPTTPTSYTLTETDSYGCIKSNSVSININSLPAAIAGTNKTITPGTKVTLGARSTNPYFINNNLTLTLE